MITAKSMNHKQNTRNEHHGKVVGLMDVKIDNPKEQDLQDDINIVHQALRNVLYEGVSERYVEVTPIGLGVIQELKEKGYRVFRCLDNNLDNVYYYIFWKTKDSYIKKVLDNIEYVRCYVEL